MFVSWLRRFCRGSEFIVRMAGYAAAGLMPFLAAIVSFEVFSRYFLDRPTVWAFDLSLFLFGYVASLGGAYAHQQRAHITVDIFYQKVSPKTRKVFDLISFALAIFFLVLIVSVCYDKLLDAIKYDIHRQSEWAPPMLHFWIMTIIAGCLFILQMVKDMAVNIYSLVTGNELLETAAEASEEEQQEEATGVFARTPLCETGGE